MTPAFRHNDGAPLARGPLAPLRPARRGSFATAATVAALLAVLVAGVIQFFGSN